MTLSRRRARALAALFVLLLPAAAAAQNRAFSANSIIIPVATPYQTANAGIFASYGLIYRLLQKGVTVYAIVNPAKTSFADADLTITNNSGYPVGVLNWSTGAVNTG